MQSRTLGCLGSSFNSAKQNDQIIIQKWWKRTRLAATVPHEIWQLCSSYFPVTGAKCRPGIFWRGERGGRHDRIRFRCQVRCWRQFMRTRVDTLTCDLIKLARLGETGKLICGVDFGNEILVPVLYCLFKLNLSGQIIIGAEYAVR